MLMFDISFNSKKKISRGSPRLVYFFIELLINKSFIMAVSCGISFVLSSTFLIIIFSAMQIYKPWLLSSQVTILFSGYIGSWLFILLLTAISNLETLALGKGFQSKLFPEIIFSLFGTTIACSMIHRVCATTCFVFSCIALYYINKISQNHNNAAANTQADLQSNNKRKKK